VASSYSAVAAAIYTKTNVSGVVGTGKLSGIYEGKAPQGTAYPYGVFNLQGASPVQYAFNVTPVLQEAFIQFRVYAESQEAAHTLLDAWIATLGNTLTVTGFTTEWLAVQNDLPPTDQLITGRYIYGRGTLVRIETE
jgi:hypothetical protein